MLYRFEEYSKIRDTLRQLLHEIIFKHIKMFFILPRSEKEKKKRGKIPLLLDHSSEAKGCSYSQLSHALKENHVFSFAARKDFDSGRSVHHPSFVLQCECEFRFSDSFLIYQWQNQRITQSRIVLFPIVILTGTNQVICNRGTKRKDSVRRKRKKKEKVLNHVEA